MAAYILESNKLSVLTVGALAISMAAITFGAGIASADPNDPGMTDVRPDGGVHSRQATATSGAKQCATDPGTLGTSSTRSSDVGVPMQTSHESGPSWVGSHGWQASGTTSSNPWGGHFNAQHTRTGPECKTGHANSAGRF
jgi:hypothetical protein